MNFEKLILIASILCVCGMVAVFIMHTALASQKYDIETMNIQKKEILQGSGVAETYRLRKNKNPFKEETSSIKVEIRIDPPPAPEVDIDSPPFLWNKEGL